MTFDLTRCSVTLQTTEVIFMLGIIPTPVPHESRGINAVPTSPHIMIQACAVLTRIDIQFSCMTGGPGNGTCSGTNSMKTQSAAASSTYMVGGQGQTRAMVDPHTCNNTNVISIFQFAFQTIVQTLS